MKQTSLYESHKNLGAKLVDFAGWEMPIQYKNLKEEVIAVRENVGVFDVSHMGEFFVEGNETYKFLDELVPNDIANANMLKAIYSPLCNEEGKVIDDLIIYKLTDTKAMICVNASNIDKDFAWISDKAKNYAVKLENKSDKYSLLAVQGPKTFTTLSAIDLGAMLEDIEYYSVQINNIDSDTPVIFARTGYTGEDGFEVFGPHDYIASVWNQLMDHGVMPCGLGSRDVLRLEVCYPLYGHELNEDITPLDAGLKWTVKLNKNHFIGKSALESYSPKFQLIKFQLDKGIPREGYNIVNNDGEKVGTVTSGTMSVAISKGIGLALVEKNKYYQENQYFVDIRNKQIPIEVLKKPFVSGGHK